MPIRTLEFPVVLTVSQAERIEFYFQKLKTIWNIGLARLNDFDEFTGYYSKEEKSYNPCCPQPWEIRRYWLDKDGLIIDKPTQSQKASCERIEVPFSRIIAEKSKHFLKDLPQVKTVVPAGFMGSRQKGRDIRGWLQWSEENQKPVIVTTSRFCAFGGVEAIEGCSGFSCPLIPSPQCFYTDESGNTIYPYKKLREFWDSLPSHELPVYQQPMLRHFKYDASGGLTLVIRGDNLEYREDSEELLSVPYKFRQGLMKGLSTSWQEYDKSRRGTSTHKIFRGKPKFKNQQDKINTIVHPDPKNVIKWGGKDTLRGIPTLNTIHVPGLDKRWRNSDGSRPKISVFKILKCPSGWYVQLTGELDRSQGLRRSGKAIAADPGLLNYLTFDNGEVIENPRFWRKQEEKLARLQQRLAHKRTHNLILWLNHPNRAIEDIKKVIRVNDEDAQVLLHCKTEQEGKALIGQSRWAKLMFKRGQESYAIIQLETRIQKQHERVRRMRRSFAHRLSTWLVRNFDVFVCEDGIQSEKLRHKAGIKLDENGVAQKNNSKAKSGLTKSLSDAAHGQLLELCAQKFKEAGRTFIRYPAVNTTKECPICGTHNDMDSNFEGQRYVCSECNWESGRDQKPGILMLTKLYDEGKVEFEQLSDATKAAIVYRENWLATQGRCLKQKKKKNHKKKAA